MRRLSLSLALAGSALLAGPAQAQPSDLDHSERPALGFALGAGTLFDLDRRSAGIDHEQPTAGINLFGGDSEGFANEGSLALALSYVHPLLRYAALGAQVQYLGWSTREDYLLGYPMYTALDFSILPRAQLPLSRRVRLIATVPFGVSLNFIDPEVERRGFREEVSTGTGFNLGLRAGTAIALGAPVGLTAELELSQHWLHHTWTYIATDGEPFADGSEEVRYASTTLLLRVGVYYALP